MEFAVFSTQGLNYVFKWLHFFFGIMWIGHLYYFNFTQGTAIAQVEPAGVRPNVLSKFLPVAMWWFRWGAMWTFVTGLLMLHFSNFPLSGDWGVKILTGSVFGILMWANVWFIIWPAQKIVIQSNQQVATGGQPLPTAAANGAKALLASRTNTLFSIPMLFYMGAASHLPMQIDVSRQSTWWIVLAILAGGLEFNAIKGKLGPMQTVKGVITCGFILAAVVYVLMEVIL
ncbi:MAG: urate hydroxylase PuuD [Bdellovibrionaceae bacterium]|nr:urate hydroxylase PuuD [Pseudobdellovibrionaceae bacterium]